jgi:hypothetical protein
LRVDVGQQNEGRRFGTTSSLSPSGKLGMQPCQSVRGALLGPFSS